MKNKNKKVLKTEHRINNIWKRHFTLNIIILHVFVLLLIIFVFLSYNEFQLTGEAWYKTNTNRQIESTVVDNQIQIIYSFNNDEINHKVVINSFIKYLFSINFLFILFEIPISSYFKYRASKKTVKALAPLKAMAETANRLSKLNLSEQKYANLTNAIKDLKPNSKLYVKDVELKNMENAVNSLIDRLHKNYEQQAQFVSDASHELRTPIAVIQGYTNMLSRWGKSDINVLEESIDAIMAESKHMQTLVEQLLFLARGDADKLETNFKTIDLSVLLNEIYDEYMMIAKNRIWKITNEENCIVFGDTDLLKQAIRILVDNSIKYSSENSKISLKCESKNNEIIFSVQDNGIGINSKDLSKVFDRFYRSDPARVRESGGTGLGLSLAKWIIDKHNGYFNIISIDNIGTNISFHLNKFKEETAT
ncbi:MAG: sensor histidine kinase [Christensenellaceae bacterium]|nr:sensor histidine kinase [Christensenellaceae bacterium]